MKVEVAIKKLYSEAKLPQRMTDKAAGYDLYSANKKPLTLKKKAILLVPTGIAISLPDGYEAQIRPRSGLAAKHGIGVLNSPGTIDADYRGEIKVIMFNFGEQDFDIPANMRIAQMIVTKFAQVDFIQKEELDSTERSSGGFGFTGG